MKLEIVKIHNHGDQTEEYVELKVTAACNLDHYMITDNTYTADGHISNKLRHPYWFLSQIVKAGDYVFLYTKPGTNTSFPNMAGSTTYAIYWGVREPLWNDTGDCALLFELSDWKTTRASSSVQRLSELVSRNRF